MILNAMYDQRKDEWYVPPFDIPIGSEMKFEELSKMYRRFEGMIDEIEKGIYVNKKA